jgi:hypothetical protein
MGTKTNVKTNGMVAVWPDSYDHLIFDEGAKNI